MAFDLGRWMRRPSGDAVMIGLVPAWRIKGAITDRQARYERLLIEYRLALAMGMTHKVWQTIGDDKSRPGHSAANGQRQLIDSPFVVGGERLFLPSDPGASLHQTANCRCLVRYTRLPTDRPTPPSLGAPEPPGAGDIQPLDSTVLPAILPTPADRTANTDRYTIDLREHEGPTTGGHTIRDHVGKSREQIRRLMNTPTFEGTFGGKKVIQYKPLHGSFSSVQSANRLVNATLSANGTAITADGVPGRGVAWGWPHAFQPQSGLIMLQSSLRRTGHHKTASPS